MLTTRTYRSARSLEEALEEIRRGTGSQFCPRTVEALERTLGGAAGAAATSVLLATA